MIAKVAVIDDWLGIAARCAQWDRLAGKADVSFFKRPIRATDAPRTLRDFDVIVPMRERMTFPKELLQQLPKLKLLALTGYFAPFVDTAYCAERDIMLCGSGIYTPYATAELTFGLMLSAIRDLPAADRAIRAGDFQDGLHLGGVLAGKTLGIVGLGNIGKQIAKYAQAFEMSVIAWSPNLTREIAEPLSVRAVTKEELFREADIVTLHMKYSPRSHHIIGAAEINAMKRGALLVNTARSGLVNTAAMIDALRAGRINAALDVFDDEPLPEQAELLQLPGTVLSPHLGFSTDETFRNFYEQCLENIEAFLAGNPIRVLKI